MKHLDLNEEEKYIKDFFNNLSNEEFVEILKECGCDIRKDANNETSI